MKSKSSIRVLLLVVLVMALLSFWMAISKADDDVSTPLVVVPVVAENCSYPSSDVECWPIVTPNPYPYPFYSPVIVHSYAYPAGE